MLPKSPFYSVYGVDRNTFAHCKVVWGRVGNTVSAAVVGKANSAVGRKVALPFEAMMIPFAREQEAQFVCGCLNSVHAQMVVVGSIVLHPDTHVMRRVRVPKFDGDDSVHNEIATLSKTCHELTRARRTGELGEAEKKLDAACGKIWGISVRQTKMIKECLRQVQG